MKKKKLVRRLAMMERQNSRLNRVVLSQSLLSMGADLEVRTLRARIEQLEEQLLETQQPEPGATAEIPQSQSNADNTFHRSAGGGGPSGPF